MQPNQRKSLQLNTTDTSDSGKIELHFAIPPDNETVRWLKSMQLVPDTTKLIWSGKPTFTTSPKDQTLQPGRLLRINQFIPSLIPMSRAHFLALVKESKMPQPIKLSERCTCWRSDDLIRVIEQGTW